MINKIRDEFLHYEAAIFETPELENLKIIYNAEEPKINK
jgi:hypothetical protein